MAVCACCGKVEKSELMAKMWKENVYVCQKCIDKAGGYTEISSDDTVDDLKEAIQKRLEKMQFPRYVCPQCGEKMEAADQFCKNCGQKIDDKELAHRISLERECQGIFLCPQCGEQMGASDRFCRKCGRKIDEEALQRRIYIEKEKQEKDELDTLSANFKQLILGRCCPVCGGTNLQYSKSPFSLGKAAVGVAVAGPVGLLAGALGDSKTYAVCKNCGHGFYIEV